MSKNKKNCNTMSMTFLLKHHHFIYVTDVIRGMDVNCQSGEEDVRGNDSKSTEKTGLTSPHMKTQNLFKFPNILLSNPAEVSWSNVCKN